MLVNDMKEKLMKILDESPRRFVWLAEKNIIVEEKFGEHKEIIKKYRITSLNKDFDYLINYVMAGDIFVRTSPMGCISKMFLKQIVEQLETSDETFASMKL
jgi:hypothetical protein